MKATETVYGEGQSLWLDNITRDLLLSGTLERYIEGLPAIEEVLARFAAAGIDVNALANQLQDEGAKSFVTSWRELMEVIASKSAALDRAS
jgi:transaldolase